MSKNLSAAMLPMIFSIRTRILLCFVVLVVLTGGSLMRFAHRDTIATLRANARDSLNNVMVLLERELTVSHAGTLQLKLEAVEDIKAHMRMAAQMGLMALHSLSAADRSGPSCPDFLNAFISAEKAFSEREISFSGFHHTDTGWREIKNGSPMPDFLLSQIPLLSREGDDLFTLHPLQPDTLFLVKPAGDVILVTTAPIHQVEARLHPSMAENIRRFQELMQMVRIQKTGFAMALDSRLSIIAGTPDAILHPQLRETLAASTFTSVQRRLMILPASETDPSEIFYLVSYFRPLDWHLVVAAPIDELEATVFSIVSRQLVITGIIVLAGILAGLVLSGRIARPLRRLTVMARTFPDQDLMTLSIDQLSETLPTRRKDEIGELARSFAFMAGELHLNVHRLVETTATNERLSSELQVARDIQYGILPEPLPPCEEIEIYADMVTAREVGGDLYDFFFVDADHLCFVMGDVSGKSVPAALFMSMAVTTIRSVCADGRGLSPDRVLSQTNTMLARHNPENMFVSLCLGLLNIRSGALRWVGAGHMPPIRISASGATALAHSGDLMAGILPDMTYHVLEDRLHPGESIFLYTDGVSEAFNETSEMFGDARIFECLGPLHGKPAETIGKEMVEAVHRFSGKAEQSDDIAIMVIRYTGTADTETS